MTRPSPNERAELLRLARTLVKKVESGDVVSFIAVCATGRDGDSVGTVIACHPDWAREALAFALEQMPPTPTQVSN